MLKIIDLSQTPLMLSQVETELLLEGMNTLIDPRISSCIDCSSSVVATEPMNRLLDEMLSSYPNYSDFISRLIEYIENTESVHLYILEENECVHRLWMDPIANEWTLATGEKRLHK